MSKYKINVGDEVGWQWGSGLASGVVESINETKTQIESKGSVITRNGSKSDPALVIKHKSGNDVLKLAHEVQKL